MGTFFPENTDHSGQTSLVSNRTGTTFCELLFCKKRLTSHYHCDICYQVDTKPINTLV